jgi:hypothetical protein
MKWTLKHAKACLEIYETHLKKKNGEHATWACLRAVEELMDKLPSSIPETISAEDLKLVCKEGTWITSTNTPDGCDCAVLAIEEGLREASVCTDKDGNVDTIGTYNAFHQLKHPLKEQELCPWLEK